MRPGYFRPRVSSALADSFFKNKSVWKDLLCCAVAALFAVYVLSWFSSPNQGGNIDPKGGGKQKITAEWTRKNLIGWDSYKQMNPSERYALIRTVALSTLQGIDFAKTQMVKNSAGGGQEYNATVAETVKRIKGTELIWIALITDKNMLVKVDSILIANKMFDLPAPAAIPMAVAGIGE